MGGRSELTRLASLLITGPEDTGVALLEAGASSVGVAAGAEGSPEEEETGAMEVAALSPGVVVMEAPETTMPAGVRVAAMAIGAPVGPTETAMTAMLHTTSKSPLRPDRPSMAVIRWGSFAERCVVSTLLPLL